MSSRSWTLQERSQSLVCQMVHNQHTVTPSGGSGEGSLMVLESGWNMKTFRLRLSCKTASVEVRNGEVGMKYVKMQGWDGPLVRRRRRRKRSVRSEDGDDSGNSNIRLKEEVW